MNLLNILYDIIIAPIEYIIETIFCYILTMFPSFGLLGAIIGISLAINFLALPLYLKADSLQLKERKLQKNMEKRVKKIKQTFSGDEQFMILSEYYKRNNYHPLYALRSSLSILIEIPFFIAAYHFLSTCPMLAGQGIWFLTDLSQPDRLFTILGIEINFLPILMTVINIISSMVYTKGAPFREKLQTYLLACLFLVILYQSPSGLVCYWILNNLFSMIKNIVMKLKHPAYVLYGVFSIILVFMSIFFHIKMGAVSIIKKIILDFVTLVWISLPYIYKLYQKVHVKKENYRKEKNGIYALFICACISLWIMAGVLLPSSIISTSPTEFSFQGSVDNPLTYVGTNFVFYFGLFVFWPFCIYKMFQDKLQNIFAAFFFCSAVCAVLNIYLFKTQYGNITTIFEPENRELYVQSSNSYTIPAIVCLLLVCIIFYIVFIRNKLYVLTTLIVGLILTECIVSGTNIITIKRDYDDYVLRLGDRHTDDMEEDLQIEFSLTRTGKNIMVIFCDRLGGSYFPYLLEQFPELYDSYNGFVYYPNCISFGNGTYLGSPAMMGGYEYTPLIMNERSAVERGNLVDLHNEAIMVLPLYFSNLGYDVKVTDPPLANYVWEGDYTPFEKYSAIEVTSLIGKYNDRYMEDYSEEYFDTDYGKLCIKHCRIYSMLQMICPPLRNTFGGRGRYYSIDNQVNYQQVKSSFIDNYAYMFYLPELTDAENIENTYTFIDLEVSHGAEWLLAPDYHWGIPTEENPYAGIGNYPMDTSVVDEESGIKVYHVSACTILLLARYLDTLKEMGVYDNTRIIIVADHGTTIPTAPFYDFNNPVIPSNFNPILLVKDFYSTGDVQTDMTFRTNADTPYIATQGIEGQMENPFSGKIFTNSISYEAFDVFFGGPGDGYEQFEFSGHYSIKNDIFDESNWTMEETE